jgi:hypothetical protein
MVRRSSIPTRGRWFEPGQRVRGVTIDGREDIVADDEGDEQVHACTRRLWDGPEELVIILGPYGERPPTALAG